MSIYRKTVDQTRASRHPSPGFPFSFPSRFLGCLLASCALAPAASAAQSLDAHEHGQARMQIALENNQVDLIFTSPAYNLAGFEHEARTDEEKKLLVDIHHWLETTPLINTDSGACTVAAVTVKLGGDEKSHHGHDDDDHHEDRHDDHSEEESTHRDFEVTQQLTCMGMSGNAALTSPLPGRFPELEELTIEWAGPSGQGSTLMTPESGTFSLNHSS